MTNETSREAFPCSPRTLWPALAVIVLAAACGGEVSSGPPERPDEGDDEARDAAFLEGGVVSGTSIRDGSGEARAVLRVAMRSDAATLGPGRIGLGPGAVQAIIAARTGADGLDGTEDDVRLRTLSALDEVPYVGPRSWTLLLAHAESQGLPAALDPCGRGEARDGGLRLPDDVTAAVADVTRLVATNRLEVWGRATRKPSAEELELFRSRTCAALGFDYDALGREPDDVAMATPVRVVVLDASAYGAATGAPGTYGVTLPGTEVAGDAFVVPTEALRDLPELDDTLAHELAHVFHFRFAPNDAMIPWYLIEGSATALGAAFGLAAHGQVTGFATAYIRAATGADARTTFQRYGLEDLTQNLGEVGHDQSMSGFFVEYLRVFHPGGAAVGVKDVQARLLDVMSDVSEGRRLASAFSLRVGVPLDDAKDAYIRHLDATVGQWPARAAGTVFYE